MKKSIIAMAVAGALAVPAIASADATLYGSLRMTVDKTDNVKTDMQDRGSRLGVRGNVDLGLQDTVGIYQVEFRYNPISGGDFDTRGTANSVTRGGDSFIGATGSWGTVMAGIFDHPTYSLVTSRTEISAAILDVGATTGYADGGVTNTLAYVSPNMSGFQVIAGTVINGGTSDTTTFDGWQLGASFDGVENLNVGAAYGRLSSSANLPAQDQYKWGLAADYTLDALNVAVSYDRVKDKVANTTDKGWGVAGTYNITQDLSAALRYSTAKITDGDRRKATQVEVANRMGRGIVSVGYADRNRQLQNGDDTFYVGYRLDF